MVKDFSVLQRSLNMAKLHWQTKPGQKCLVLLYLSIGEQSVLFGYFASMDNMDQPVQMHFGK